MDIKLTNEKLEITKEGNTFSLLQPLEPSAMVAHVANGKNVVTYSLTELELRAIYELLKKRFT